MVAGVHCGSTFAPVSRLQSIRTVLALAAEKNLEVLQYYVLTAFLNSPVDETIFVKTAPGRGETDEDGVQQVMKLRKNLYGIPQAPVNWHGTIDDFVTTIGFTLLKSDPCIYIYTHKDEIHNPVTKKGPTLASRNKDTVILIIYVDDRLMMGPNKVLLKQLEEKLVLCFDTKYMGDVSLVIGKSSVIARRDTHHLASALHQVYIRDVRHGGVQSGIHSQWGRSYLSTREKGTF